MTMKYYLLTLSLFLLSCSAPPMASFGEQSKNTGPDFPESAYSNMPLGFWQHNPLVGTPFAVNRIEKDGSGVVMWAMSFPAGMAFSGFKPHRRLGDNRALSRKSFLSVDEKGQGSALTTPFQTFGWRGESGGIRLFKVEDFQTQEIIFGKSGVSLLDVDVDATGTGRFLIGHDFGDKTWEGCETLPLKKVDVVEMTNHKTSTTHSFDLVYRNQPFIDRTGNGFAIGIFPAKCKEAVYAESIENYTTVERSLVHPQGAANFRVYDTLPPAMSWTVRESERNDLYLGTANSDSALKIIGPISLAQKMEIETMAFSEPGKGLLVIEDIENSELQIHSINDYTLTQKHIIPMAPGSRASLTNLSLDENGEGLLVWKEGYQPQNVTNFMASIFTQSLKNHKPVEEKFTVAEGIIGYIDVSLSEEGLGLILWSQSGTKACQSSDCTAEVLGRMVSNYAPLSR